MFIKSSIQEKNVKRAKNELIAFSQEHKHKVTTFYIENKSGATLVLTKLMQLITIIVKEAR